MPKHVHLHKLAVHGPGRAEFEMTWRSQAGRNVRHAIETVGEE